MTIEEFIKKSTGKYQTKSPRKDLGKVQAKVALVFTDIVDSTVIGKTLGDSAWIQLLTKHFERARYYNSQYGGYEIKLIGDSCMMAFPTADKALLFALALLKDPGDPLISIRAGIHVGMVKVVENEIYGLMVNYTSRVVHAMKRSGIAFSAAAKSEIERQLADTVKDFGKVQVLHHEHLKGFTPDEQLLWEIMTPETRALRVSPDTETKPLHGTAKSHRSISDQHKPGLASPATLSQRLYGSLEFDGVPPNDEEVKEIITDHLLKKYS